MLILLLLTLSCSAGDLAPRLDEVSIDYARYKQDTRLPILYPNVPKERLDVNINFSFLKIGYINNTIHSLTDANQFRLIGWHYQVGVRLGKWVDIYGDHFSQHLLDTQLSNFPVENSAGIKFYLYRLDRARGL